MKRFLKQRPVQISLGVSLLLLLIAGIWAGIFVARLSNEARERFAGKKWELPARIYARPLELYAGLQLSPDRFERELSLMQYRQVPRIDAAGSFSRIDNAFTLFTRAFHFGDGLEPSRKFRVTFQENRIINVTEIDTGEAVSLARIDPAHIGSFYPTHNQDRLWVRFKDLSPELIQTIMAVEDRDFYDHWGVRPMAILRAMVVNIKEGRAVQGGSTLTQQLVKNLFLTREQTISRKVKEAIMALSLEWHYDKDRIFEAYINEVYMGQDGKRSIHGFGMASRFYFGRSLDDLRPKEVALLVGLLKGPSYYDPRRHPERATERRNVVLKVMDELKLIRPDEAKAAMDSPLDVIPKPPSGDSPFPPFFELVKRKLFEEYKEDDLRTEGLRIFTTLDPQVQFAAEAAVAERLSRLEEYRNLPPGELQAAAIVTATAGNDVLALVGDRDPDGRGFNRALDARRSIGSLIKPVVYLTALTQPERYSLVTPLDDSEIEVPVRGRGDWSPKNYDNQYHGMVPLYRALARSYNVATVRLGMSVGVEKVLETVRKLGVEGDFPAYPSVLLGTMSMSVIDVARIYQTFASGGFSSPVRAIQGVYKPDGTALQRYPLTVKQSVDPAAVYLLNKALQAVVVEGTAKSLTHLLPGKMAVAGKTGTTNDLRDSWFAGFTGNRLAAVWVGRDDNQPCGLSGSTGALQIWGDLMSRILNTPLRLSEPENVTWEVVNLKTGFLTGKNCPDAVSIPFIAGHEPKFRMTCGKSPITDPQQAPDDDFLDRLKEMF